MIQYATKELKPKQIAFIRAFLDNGFLAAQAAYAAGYTTNSAHVEGVRLLRCPEIAAALGEYFDEQGIASGIQRIVMGKVAVTALIVDEARRGIIDWIENYAPQRPPSTESD